MSLMSWDAKDIALLKRLWFEGQSAAQIARRLGCSRNAVCGMLTRLGLKRGHKSPTARPKIRPAPKLRPSSAPAPVRSHRRCRQGQRRGSSPRNSAGSSFTPFWLKRSETPAKRHTTSVLALRECLGPARWVRPSVSSQAFVGFGPRVSPSASQCISSSGE